MKKVVVLLLTLTVLLSALLTLASCGTPPTPEAVIVKLNFLAGNEVLASFDVDLNDLKIPVFPDNPTKQEFTFDGWFFDSESFTKPANEQTIKDCFDQQLKNYTESKAYEKEIKVYAKFTENAPPAEPEDINWWDGITYDTAELRFQMTKNSGGGLSSGCERYLAGEGVDVPETVDNLIKQRNDSAYHNTGVTVKYFYYPDNSDEHGFTKSINVIVNECYAGGPDGSDIYCGFLTDMVVSSLHGAFANVYSKQRTSGNNGELNYFIPNATIENGGYESEGYMYSLMASLTLSEEKVYCIASDYFIDLVRSFLVIPVNKELFNTIADGMVEDLNESGTSDINDLFAEVENGDWTYDKLLAYCAKTEIASSGQNVGFAVNKYDMRYSSALLYSSSVEIINKAYSQQKGGYVYYYAGASIDNYVNDDPNDTVCKRYSDVSYATQNQGIIDFANKVATLIESSGVSFANATEIRNRFASNTILFGGIEMLGNLESEIYRDKMNNDEVFGILPIPVYKSGDAYNTQVDSTGRIGAISNITAKFAQCTAFIHYQSTNSKVVIDEYFKSNFKTDGNVKMLNLMRKNLKSAFDQILDDVIVMDESPIEPFKYTYNIMPSWKYQFYVEDYQVDMNITWQLLINDKQQKLFELESKYSTLPN